MIEWLTDTLLMTGLFLGLVLLIRRPVGRWFGAGAAYALWALPMIRLVLPPLALPRRLMPHYEVGVQQITASASVPVEVVIPAVHVGPAAAAAAPALAAEPGLLAQLPWTALALGLWLGGAALFLAWRAYGYRMMRRDLLAGARQMATHGEVRIIESPAAAAPLAFGVFDKVIALPVGFLAEADSETSDFAIAHELEHHAGSDLLALMAMQPLFALHWFNPLAWAAWRALRSDQEAACDARVMAGRDGSERALYGRLIASFAGGRRLALIAPMAGPLSGDKPIIHRLKALGRKDVTTARRVLGRGLFAVAVVTVPATATVSYAAMEDEQELAALDGDFAGVPAAPAAPAVPAVPQAGKNRLAVGDVPPVPDAPPVPAAPEWDGVAAIPAPPEPPLPPAPPAPPAAAAGTRVTIQKQVTRDREAQRMEAEARHVSDEALRASANAQRMSAHAQRMAAEAMARAPRVEESVSADGKRRTVRIVSKDDNGRREVRHEMVLDESCPADQRREARSSHGGSTASVVICTGAPKVAMTATVNALRSARAAIESDRNLDAQVRAEVLADLDGEITDALREARSEND